ncbi:hypothetical protein J9R26_001363 [Salmonella enterica]|uniref:Uncharacterized protein n=2 Tax=Salmonella enterica TaxID=28901 RepID=A0A5U8K126_SALEB|nr:hypothetical protein [Salmonella enterica]EBR8572720.1 hypothetical protein [Salmonella enterica subsp. enterica serovar Java]EBS1712124.1 hypothetical protein [Salmonella enterica subsp. enterica serovar Vitkin]EBS2505554.1 hypothetical protein [Salmonella enterica subsp. enterica serovar Stanley]ECI8026260.1 hypothetical protein [Salmonella enterica subsp. enterica serovar Ramatgan]EDH9952380.1 hypothetical protein [Salmonella enterica subsp. enterica serovar Newport]EDV2742109.1 hypothe
MSMKPSLMISCPPELEAEISELATRYKLINPRIKATTLSAASNDALLIVLAAVSTDGFWESLASMFQTWINSRPSRQTIPEKRVKRTVLVRSWKAYQEVSKTTEFYNFNAEELQQLKQMYEDKDEIISCIIPCESEESEEK